MSTTRYPYVFLVKLLRWKPSIEIISIGVKNIGHLFQLVSEIIKADRLHLFLLSDRIWTDDNKHLESLENGTELIVCTEEQTRNYWSILNWKGV